MARTATVGWRQVSQVTVYRVIAGALLLAAYARPRRIAMQTPVMRAVGGWLWPTV